jgi:hypothetical protein
MKTSQLAIIVASVLFGAAPLLARDNSDQGASRYSPGHRMQNSTRSTGPGASEYAPGHRKHSGASASDYAPGHLKKHDTGSTGGSTGTSGRY